MSMHSRALATQSQNVLASFRNSKSSSSQRLTSLKLDNRTSSSPQLDLELAQLSRAPVRRVRYLPELDMEIGIIEPPRKAIVNKNLRVQALREHWDEKGIHPIHPIHQHPYGPKPSRFEISKLRK